MIRAGGGPQEERLKQVGVGRDEGLGPEGAQPLRRALWKLRPGEQPWKMGAGHFWGRCSQEVLWQEAALPDFTMHKKVVRPNRDRPQKARCVLGQQPQNNGDVWFTERPALLSCPRETEPGSAWLIGPFSSSSPGPRPRALR